jgi:D-tyrosyl-tRNA(Tyr) deacylase
MRVVIQRVKEAEVVVEGKTIGRIGKGLLILLGVEIDDSKEDADWLSHKICQMRIFSDDDDKMNLDILQAGGNFLVVSQFTLHASTKKGNRPSFIRAARPDIAIPLYTYFIEQLEMLASRKVETGEFGAMMDVRLINDGPVTITIDSKAKE